MKLENFIALRYIRESNKNKDISISSIVAISVIAIAIIFFISAVSIMNGYIYGIMKIAFEIKTFHIDYPVYSSYNDSKYILDQVQKNKDVAYADLYKEAKVLLNANSKTSGLIFFRSVPEDIFEKDKGFRECIKILEGTNSLGKNEILLSKKISEKLRIKLGSDVYITAMIANDNPKIILRRLKVTGIFTTGYVELDEQLAYISNKTGLNVFDSNVAYNIFIKLKDYTKARKVAMDLDLNGYSGMTTWEEANYNELTALNFEKNVIAFIVILVVFVAALNILTTINMTVHEKKQDIGILKAVGYSPKQINIIFMLNGIYLGFIGVVIGISLGILIMHWLNEILQAFAIAVNSIQNIIYKILSLLIKIDAPAKFEIFSKDFYLDKIYTRISFTEIMIVSSLTLLYSSISSIIPAIKAGKVKPIEVIKNG